MLILNLQNSLFTSNKPLKMGFFGDLIIKIENLSLVSKYSIHRLLC